MATPHSERDFSPAELRSMPREELERIILGLRPRKAGIEADTRESRPGAPEPALDEAVRERERYRLLMSESRDIMLFFRIDGQIIEVNPAAVSTYGYSHEELLSASLRDLRGEETWGDIPSQIGQLGSGPFTFETSHRRKDGTRFPVEVSWSEAEAHGERVILSIVRDITARKEADAALRASESLKSSILKCAMDGIITMDHDGLVMDFNPAAEQTFGFRREEIVGRPLAETIIPERMREQHLQGLARYLAGGEAKVMGRRIEVPALHADGHEFLIELSINRIIGSEPAIFTATMRDITHRKLAEAALRESEARFRGVVESATDAIVSTDAEQRVVLFNGAAERMFGVPVAEALGSPLDRFIPERFRPGHGAHVRRFGETGATSRTMGALGQISALRADGSEFPIEASISKVELESGRFYTVIIRDVSAQHEAEAALRTSEDQFYTMANAVSQLVWRAEPDGFITWYNQRWYEYTGTTPEQMEGWGWQNVHDPETLPEVMNVWKTSIATGQPFEMTFPLRGADGVFRPFLTRVAPLKDEQGRVLQWFGTNTNVDDLKRAEVALRESEERYRATFDSAPVGIAHVGLDGRWLHFNDAVCTITGYAREKLATLGFAEITHPDDVEADWAQARRLLAGEISSYSMEKRYVREDRSIVWVNLTVSLLLDPEGQPVNFISVIEDITARVVARREREKLLQMIEASNDFIAMADLDGHLTYMNAGAKKMIGLAPGEDPGSLHLADYVPEPWQKFLRDTIMPTARERGYWEGEMQLRHMETGALVDVFRHTFLIRDPQTGEAACFASVTRDITAQKRDAEALRKAKETAEAANQAKDRFLAVLSHELRTPLTPVLMAVGALEHDPGLRPDVREDLVMIKRNIELETKLIDDLLDVSRIANGKLQLDIESFDLNETVRRVCDICLPEARGQDITLQTDLDPAAGAIMADSARLQQVLWNVVKNAVKFTPRNGRVRVTTSCTADGRREIRVTDTGIGIPAETLPQIFDAFEQGDRKIMRQFGGLGLGLAISKAIMTLHGGSIRGESDGPEHGSTFIIELPAKAPGLIAAEARRGPSPENDNKTVLRLLLVDDHADTVRTLSRLLRRAGFEVVTAGDVASALAAVKGGTFDVLVSDMGLPDGSGCEIMKQVRALGPMPGIAMSGYGMPEDVRRSHDAGFAEHLVKPLDVSKLIAAIHRVAGG